MNVRNASAEHQIDMFLSLSKQDLVLMLLLCAVFLLSAQMSCISFLATQTTRNENADEFFCSEYLRKIVEFSKRLSSDGKLFDDVGEEWAYP